MAEFMEVEELFLEVPSEPLEIPRTDLQLPCLVIEGLSLEIEIEFLKQRPIDEENSIPLYIRQQGVEVPANKTNLDLDTLLVYRKLGYNVELYLPNGEKRDLNDPSKYVNFIRL